MKIKSTKDRLLLILKKHHAISMDEIMEFFTISEPAVRKQLHDLESNDLVQKRKQKNTIGRPSYTYALTKKGHKLFPNQNERLPVEILKDLEALQGSEIVGAVLYKRMEREEKHLSEVLAGKDVEEKLQNLVEVQNESGYMFELKHTEEGNYVLVNYHCPIANIASHYKQVCSNEKKMFNHVFPEGKVTLESYITNGSPVCQWLVNIPKKDD
jgi:predicted ArsR family transcriptional regulator